MMPESKTPEFIGAEILGVHAEGPFVNPKERAHRRIQIYSRPMLLAYSLIGT